MRETTSAQARDLLQSNMSSLPNKLLDEELARKVSHTTIGDGPLPAAGEGSGARKALISKSAPLKKSSLNNPASTTPPKSGKSDSTSTVQESPDSSKSTLSQKSKTTDLPSRVTQSRQRSSTVNAGTPDELKTATRIAYENRFFSLLKSQEISTPLTLKQHDRSSISSVGSQRSFLGFSRGNVASVDTSMYSFTDALENAETESTASLPKPKSLKDKYLGFLRFSKKHNDKHASSKDFMPSNSNSLSNFSDIDDQYAFPDPIVLLERLSKALENCHWTSPVVSDELYIVDVLFDSNIHKAWSVIKGISDLNLTSGPQDSSTLESEESMSTSSAWHSAVQSRRATQTGSDNLHPGQYGGSYNSAMVLSETQAASSLQLQSVTSFSTAAITAAVIEGTPVGGSGSDDYIRRSSKTLAPRLPKKPAPNPIPEDDKRKALHKFNSCSTLFTVDTTVYNPATNNPQYMDITLKAVAHAIHTHLTRTHAIYQELLTFDNQGKSTSKFAPRVFKSAEFLSEKLYPIWRVRRIPDAVLDHPEIMQPPTEHEVFQFIKQIFVAADLTAEVGIIALIYLERLMFKTKITLFGLNCFRAILGSIMMASKVWDDQAVWNVDFKTIMADLGLEDLNSLERWWLKKVKFDVHIKRALFAKYWFEIREVAERVYGVKLGKNRVIGIVEKKLHSKEVSPIDQLPPNLLAPALRYQEEVTRRMSKHDVDIAIPRPLTEAHMHKISAASTYSQTKIRETFSTGLASTEDMDSDTTITKDEYKSKDRLKKETPRQSTATQLEVLGWGGSNLRRTKSDNLYNPQVPAASVL